LPFTKCFHPPSVPLHLAVQDIGIITTMTKHEANAGADLLFLLRQQRYLYHQLKMLAARQQQLGATNSPESLLEVISGRRKLVEKLREVNGKLRLVKTSGPRVFERIGSGDRDRACRMASEVRDIIGEIRAMVPSETAINLPLEQEWVFEGPPAQSQPQ
jgi:hypothetical protein